LIKFTANSGKMDKIQFGTDGWRAIIGDTFTLKNLARVTEATALWLKSSSETPSVALGYDCRFNGSFFAKSVANQLAQSGVRVFLSPGFVSTPMVSLATQKRQLTAGIILTASHNPPEYSGFKIKGYYGGPATPSMIQAVEQLIPETTAFFEDKFEALLEAKMIEWYDMEALYENHLKTSFDLSAIRSSGIKIGYDAMYGAGQSVFKKVFPTAELLHCEFNPSFMGQAPEPIEKNLVPFSELIRGKNLDIGLATDGDADRIGLYDENGNFVDSHNILLLLIHYLKHYKQQSGSVICTFSCTSKIKVLCDYYEIPMQITKIGFKYIAEIMLNETVLVGGEESGGIAVTGHVPERDGIYIGITLFEFMAKTGKKLTELIEEVYAITGSFAVERNDLHITEELKQHVLTQCKNGTYSEFGGYKVINTEDLDGFKFHFPSGEWVMIRPSGTEPVLRVYAESQNKEGAFKILDSVVKTLLNK